MKRQGVVVIQGVEFVHLVWRKELAMSIVEAAKELGALCQLCKRGTYARQSVMQL
jgi:predicted transcriptional regulator